MLHQLEKMSDDGCPGSLLLPDTAARERLARLYNYSKAPLDTAAYMTHLRRQITMEWTPPPSNESRQVVVQFKVHTTGNLSDLKLINSSGKTAYDLAALG